VIWWLLLGIVWSRATIARSDVERPLTERRPAVASAWLDRYDLARPASHVLLPPELREISGLAAWNARYLIAHNDERSRLYLVRIADGRVARTIDVGRTGGLAGDYEEVLRDGHRGYLLRSDGSILEFVLDDTSAVIPARKYAALQGTGCEFESLALDVVGPTLVAVCKHERGRASKEGMLVLRWDPSGTDPPRVAFRVPWSALASGRGAPRFTASAMSRTPDGRSWLVIDGHDGRIAELARDGAVIAVRTIPQDLLPQAEGITFGRNETLYLSSEGGRGPGVLAAFPPRAPHRAGVTRPAPFDVR
jgi:hypothetical protein